MRAIYQVIISAIVFFGTIFGGLFLYESYLSETELELIPEQTDSNLPLIEKQVESIPDTTNLQCKGNEMCLAEKIVRVVDGDTIYLQGDYKIRLSLTNTPERNESGFAETTQFTAKLCPVGTTALVDQDDKQPYDVYDRILGKVMCGNKILNAELLYNGHANILTRYCTTSEFSHERWAQDFGC